MGQSCIFRTNLEDEEPYICKRNRFVNDRCILHMPNATEYKDTFDKRIKDEIEDSSSDTLELIGVEFHHIPEALKTKTFKKKIRFDHAIFHCSLGFHNATFQESCKFASTQFRGNVLFEGCTFVGDFQFEKITDNKVAIRFKDFEFRSSASFSKFTTRSAFSLENGTFEEGSDFDQVTFAATFLLSDVKFNGKTNFHNCSFNSPIQMKVVTFSSETHFVVSRLTGDQRFEKVKFLGATRFNRVHVLNINFNFIECDFKELRILDLPLLEGSGRIRYYDCEWPTRYWKGIGRSIIADENDSSKEETKSKTPQTDMKRPLLVLKAYEELHRTYYDNSEYDQAREFYVSSMVQKRKLEKVLSVSRLTSLIYSILSRYGESMLRPFLAMVTIWLLFPLILMQVGGVPNGTNTIQGNSTDTKSEQSVEELPNGNNKQKFFTDDYWNTFKVSFSLSTFIRGGNTRPSLASNENMILILETVLNGLFFGFFIMAIRRRFVPIKPIRKSPELPTS